MRSLLTGLCVTLVICLASYAYNDSSLIYKVAGLIGGMSWVISGIVSDAFVRRNPVKGDMDFEQAHERNKSLAWASTWFLFGLPNIVVAVIVFFIHR
jgi:hypothetical protein